MLSAMKAGAPAPFIVGVGRSGTTLLRLMLDAHPDIAIPYETHFAPSVLDRPELTCDEFFEILTSAATWPNMGLKADEFRAALNGVAPFSPAAGLRTFYGLWAQRYGKHRWGDKTPTYRAHLPVIERSLPEARFIHLIRDGRDVALSYQGLWFGPGDDIEAQAQFWRDQIAVTRQLGAQVQHYLEVRYEDLLLDTVKTLTRICDFIEIPYDKRMLEYPSTAESCLSDIVKPFGPDDRAVPELPAFLAIHNLVKTPPNPSRIGRWRHGLSAAQINVYEKVAGPALQSLNYALSGS